MCVYIYIYIYWFTQAATHPAIRSLAFESLVQAPCGSTWKSELSDSMEMPKIPRWETCILRLVMARAVIAVVFCFFCFICFGRMFWQEVKTWKNHRFFFKFLVRIITCQFWGCCHLPTGIDGMEQGFWTLHSCFSKKLFVVSSLDTPQDLGMKRQELDMYLKRIRFVNDC